MDHMVSRRTVWYYRAGRWSRLSRYCMLRLVLTVLITLVMLQPLSLLLDLLATPPAEWTAPLLEEVTPLGLFYDSRFPDDDRIVSQMKYKPDNYSNDAAPLKTFLVWTRYEQKHWMLSYGGRDVFLDENCPVKACTVSGDRSLASTADVIIFDESQTRYLPKLKRPQHQVWLLFNLESPPKSGNLQGMEHMFNWSATYRHDSTLVLPYGKFFRYESNHAVPRRNYATRKTKKVAWFVSNCEAGNWRLEYAKELQKHIQLDIYGKCGNMTWTRNGVSAFQMIQQHYKFYLAFENNNCKDYITEKLWNALRYDVVPIVMGAPPEDYRRLAPPDSFIHVDDFRSPRELAQYLRLLDKRDDLYNLYFNWRQSGESIMRLSQPWWCRACAMLHAPRSRHVITDPQAWWRGKGVCIGRDSWAEHGYSARTALGRL